MLDFLAYHLGEGRVLKTPIALRCAAGSAYHLGEGRVLKTSRPTIAARLPAYHLGESGPKAADNK